MKDLLNIMEEMKSKFIATKEQVEEHQKVCNLLRETENELNRLKHEKEADINEIKMQLQEKYEEDIEKY